MELDSKTKNEYEAFQDAASSSPPGAKSALTGVARTIKSDLVASQPLLAVYYLALSVVGYITTLAICAQNGVGLLNFAKHAESLMMRGIPYPWCPILCGTLFGSIPFVVSFLFLNRFQRRFLLFRMWWLPLFVPVLFCGIFVLLGRLIQVDDWQSSFHILWIVAAIVTPYLLEMSCAVFLRQRSTA